MRTISPTTSVVRSESLLSRLSFWVSIDFSMRVSTRSISFLSSSLTLFSESITINQILSKSAAVNSARAGIAMTQKSIERKRVDFIVRSPLCRVNHVCVRLSRRKHFSSKTLKNYFLSLRSKRLTLSLSIFTWGSTRGSELPIERCPPFFDMRYIKHPRVFLFCPVL